MNFSNPLQSSKTQTGSGGGGGGGAGGRAVGSVGGRWVVSLVINLAWTQIWSSGYSMMFFGSRKNRNWLVGWLVGFVLFPPLRV